MDRKKKKEIAIWYDQFTEKQKTEGINSRHFKIIEWSKKFGLSHDSKILEIGCGIGTLTQLLLEELSENGSLVANDISELSLSIAKSKLGSYKNLSFLHGDVIDIQVDTKFDLIILPDVLEHIPISNHSDLFKKLRKLLFDHGKILIHIPNPYYLEWCHEVKPEVLQIIDQPIFTDELLKNVYSNNLYLYYLNTYTIWFYNDDYQILVLKPDCKKSYPSIESLKIKKPLKKRIKDKLMKILNRI